MGVSVCSLVILVHVVVSPAASVCVHSFGCLTSMMQYIWTAVLHCIVCEIFSL